MSERNEQATVESAIEHPTPQCEVCKSRRTRPLDDTFAVCFDCDNEWKYTIDDDVETVRYGYSKLTDMWYRVYEWVEKSDGKIQSNRKEAIPRSEVPDEVLAATNEVNNNE